MRWPTLKLGPARPVGGRRLRLVVVEDGAEGLGPYLSPDASADTMVLHQSTEEPAAELAVRVIQRIASIERSGQGVAKAVVLLGPRLDQQAMAARQLLARALLVHAQVAAMGSGELVLVVGSQADPALRHHLMALVEALVGEPEAGSMAIRIRFDSPTLVETAKVRSLRDARCMQPTIHTHRKRHDATRDQSSLAGIEPIGDAYAQAAGGGSR